MTAVKVHGGIDILRLPVSEEEHIFPPWQMKYKRSHILHSKCLKDEAMENIFCEDDCPDPCQFCVFNKQLQMPHMPDMVFPNNILIVKHKNGPVLEFNALDALKLVSNGRVDVELACAQEWKEARSENKEYLDEKVKPFDWTFTTDYKGTISGFEEVETDEKIDMDKLKKKDKILFYVDLTLFEDELHDNGIAVSSIKMRVMPTGFFILLRYFLRIDNVMLRINDTRIYHEFGNNYLIREYTSRESKVQDLNVPPTLFIEPSEIAPFLPLTVTLNHKLMIPSEPQKSELKTSVENASGSSVT